MIEHGVAVPALLGRHLGQECGAAAVFLQNDAVLADNDVNIEMISTSTIRISVVVELSKLELAVRALHTAFDLDSGEVYSNPLPERS